MGFYGLNTHYPTSNEETIPDGRQTLDISMDIKRYRFHNYIMLYGTVDPKMGRISEWT